VVEDFEIRSPLSCQIAVGVQLEFSYSPNERPFPHSKSFSNKHHLVPHVVARCAVSARNPSLPPQNGGPFRHSSIAVDGFSGHERSGPALWRRISPVRELTAVPAIEGRVVLSDAPPPRAANMLCTRSLRRRLPSFLRWCGNG